MCVCVSECVRVRYFVCLSVCMRIALFSRSHYSLSLSCLAISVHNGHYSFVSFHFVLHFRSSLGKMFQFVASNVVVVVTARAH